jgi:hypothetical protein
MIHRIQPDLALKLMRLSYKTGSMRYWLEQFRRDAAFSREAHALAWIVYEAGEPIA